MNRRYLKYLYLHKLYVFTGGLAIARHVGLSVSWWRWVLRLLAHDLSKLRPSEWRPYAAFFYGEEGEAWVTRTAKQHAAYMPPLEARARAEGQWSEVKKSRAYRFNVAWLKHLHRNPHHWQHWQLLLDSGKVVWLVPPAVVVDEMVADWIGAGTKVLKRPTIAEAVAETIVWYMAQRHVIQLREVPRQRVEHILHTLANAYGLFDLAFQVNLARQGRRTIEVQR